MKHARENSDIICRIENIVEFLVDFDRFVYWHKTPEDVWILWTRDVTELSRLPLHWETLRNPYNVLKKISDDLEAWTKSTKTYKPSK